MGVKGRDLWNRCQRGMGVSSMRVIQEKSLGKVMRVYERVRVYERGNSASVCKY